MNTYKNFLIIMQKGQSNEVVYEIVKNIEEKIYHADSKYTISEIGPDVFSGSEKTQYFNYTNLTEELVFSVFKARHSRKIIWLDHCFSSKNLKHLESLYYNSHAASSSLISTEFDYNTRSIPPGVRQQFDYIVFLTTQIDREKIWNRFLKEILTFEEFNEILQPELQNNKAIIFFIYPDTIWGNSKKHHKLSWTENFNQHCRPC